MGKPNPLYQNFNLVKAAIAAKSPTLTMVTTEAEYAGLLRGKIAPTFIKISVKNLDGEIGPAAVKQFVSGHTRILTAREIEASRLKQSNCNKGVGG